jgi:hypothetical protein
VILPVGVIFHVSTMLFMNLFFPYHLAAYAVFIDWPRIARFARKTFFKRLEDPGNLFVSEKAA